MGQENITACMVQEGRPYKGASQAVRTSSMRQNWLATTRLRHGRFAHTGLGPTSSVVPANLLAAAQGSRATQARIHALHLPGALLCLLAASRQNWPKQVCLQLIVACGTSDALKLVSRTRLSARY